MRIGYMLSDIPCKINTYESFKRCPYRFGEVESWGNFYEKFVDKKEDISFVPYEIFSSEAASNSSANITLLGSLANGAIDALLTSLAITQSRFQTLSFTNPHAFDRICFYIKRPETSPITDQPLFFLTPFSMHTWVLLALTLIVVEATAYITRRAQYTHREGIKTLKLIITFVLLLTEGLISISYLAALREVLIETGSFKPPFRNS